MARIEWLIAPIVIDWNRIPFGLTVDGVEVRTLTELAEKLTAYQPKKKVR